MRRYTPTHARAKTSFLLTLFSALWSLLLGAIALLAVGASVFVATHTALVEPRPQVISCHDAASCGWPK